MISQILLDETVEKVFPRKYHPAKSDHVIAINCVSPSKIRNIRQSYYPNHEMPKGFIGALVLNLGDIYSLDEKTLELYENKFIIYISEDVEDEEELAFVLLNQLGYIDLYLEFPNRNKEEVDESIYADFFALNVLYKVFGQEKATELASRYGPIKGE